MKIPVSVIVVARNAAELLPRCLAHLTCADEAIIVDTPGDDGTSEIAHHYGATYVPFHWNGTYPKKRQWCLDNVAVRNDWIFFVDADEAVPFELWGEIADEIKHPSAQAYFISGQPNFLGKKLRHGRWHKKITLFRKDALRYPVLDDAENLEMGEIEGHYQPVVSGKVGFLKRPLGHFCADNLKEWLEKHRRYAVWQAFIEEKGIDLSQWEKPFRRLLKKIFQQLPCRPIAAFCDSYFYKRGFLDGRAGFDYAVARAMYYWMIRIERSAVTSRQNAASDSGTPV